MKTTTTADITMQGLGQALMTYVIENGTALTDDDPREQRLHMAQVNSMSRLTFRDEFDADTNWQGQPIVERAASISVQASYYDNNGYSSIATVTCAGTLTDALNDIFRSLEWRPHE